MPTGAEETMVVYGLENFGRWKFPWAVVEGDVADLRRGNYMFLDDSATKRFGPFRVGDYREVSGTRLKIIGRTRDARSFTTTPIAFLDYRLAQRLAPERLDGNTSYMVVKLQPGADPAAVKREMQRRLPYNDVYTRAEWAAQSRGYWVESTGIGLNAYLTIFLGCLVGIVVVAQTLYTATMEHLKEFGVVKAIGGSNRTIYAILARQATIAAVVGFVLGCGMAAALAPALRAIDLRMVVPPLGVAIVFVGTLALCLAASIVSFRKVASLDPALVFRS
jgi:putative ABC transport system permease protein